MVIEMGYEKRGDEAIEQLPLEIKSAEDAERYTSNNFDRLAALEKEIEKSLNQIKDLSGLQNFSTDKLCSCPPLEVANMVAQSMAYMPSFKLLNFLFGKKDSEKIIESLVDNQNTLTENMIKISRILILLFEFQRVTADILNDLFEMCSSNIEVVQSTIETLRAKLSGEGSSLSTTAKKNVRELIQKLMARQDSLMKQEEMKQEIKRLKTANQEIIKKLDVVMKHLG